MGYGKYVNLSDGAYEIWKKKFGKYSQKFSSFVCDKLIELDIETMSINEKKEYLLNEEKELKIKNQEFKKEIESFKNEELEEREKASEESKIKKTKETKEQELYKNRIKSQIENLKEYFKIENEGRINRLAEEFVSGHFKDQTIFEFVEFNHPEIKRKAPLITKKEVTA